MLTFAKIQDQCNTSLKQIQHSGGKQAYTIRKDACSVFLFLTEMFIIEEVQDSWEEAKKWSQPVHEDHRKCKKVQASVCGVCACVCVSGRGGSIGHVPQTALTMVHFGAE